MYPSGFDAELRHVRKTRCRTWPYLAQQGLVRRNGRVSSKLTIFFFTHFPFLAFRARKEAILRTSKRTDRLKMFSISIFCATTPDPRILWRVHFSTAKIIYCNSSTPQIPIYSSAYFSPLSSFTIAQKQYFALHFS